MEQIFEYALQGFDFGYCVAINVLTYLIITAIYDIKGIVLSKWKKRIVLLICITVLSITYAFIGTDLKVLVNSSILAPVSWSWILKPICKQFNIDYKHER